MCQAMATLANGGTLHQTRLVEQVQSVDGAVESGYAVRTRSEVGISDDVFNTVKKGMQMVVEHGTAAQARVSGVGRGWQDRHGAMGRGQQRQGQVAHGLVVRGLRADGQAEVRVRVAGRGRSRRQAAQQRNGGAARRQGCCASFTRTPSPPRITKRNIPTRTTKTTATMATTTMTTAASPKPPDKSNEEAD